MSTDEKSRVYRAKNKEMNEKEYHQIRYYILDKIDTWINNTEIDSRIKYLIVQDLEDLDTNIRLFYKLGLSLNKK